MNKSAQSDSLTAAKTAVSRLLAGIQIEMTDDLLQFREWIDILNRSLKEGGPYTASQTWLEIKPYVGDLAALDEPESLYPEIDDRIPLNEQDLAQIYSYEDTDFGQAEALIHLFHDRLRFVLGLGWYVWNGMRWESDNRQAALQFGKVAARVRLRAASYMLDQAEGKEAMDAALAKVRNASLRRNLPGVLKTLKSAESEPALVTEPTQLDHNPMAFGVRNGTLMLERKKLTPPAPGDLITKRSNVMYYEDAPCPRWEQFMREVFQNDTDLIEYIQRCIGYSLTGDTSEQCFFILHGHGANGKSVFTEILRALLGEYGSAVEFKTLMHGGASDKGDDLAPLLGVRFVVASESEEGKRLNEALIKQMTGGDPLRVRHLYGKFFTFTPSFKVWLVTNHKPVIVGTDRGIWRRVRLIPFNAKFEGHNADKELSKKLLAELPGILAWAVRGCAAWQDEGLSMPFSVAEATTAYKEEMDLLGQFLEIATVAGPRDTARAGVNELYSAYKAYSDEAGLHPLTKPRLARAMKERGFDQLKSMGKYLWVGLSLKQRSEY